MLAPIQIISVITYSFSIAIVAQSKKKKYLLQDYASHLCISDATMVSLNRNFYSIKMALLPLVIIILLKSISQLLYVLVEIIISRENSQSSRIIQGTPGRL